MLLELYWCEHQLCWFAIQLQLFRETLTWLLVCPTNICTGCVLECFGSQHLRNTALHSISCYDYNRKNLLRVYSYVYLGTSSDISHLCLSFRLTSHDVMSREKEWGNLLPLLWLTSCWPSAGWAAAPDWLGSRKGTSECQGNTGTDRGSTFVQTVGTRREREREKVKCHHVYPSQYHGP